MAKPRAYHGAMKDNGNTVSTRLANLQKRQPKEGMTAEQFRNYRRRWGLTQVQFARKLGLHEMSITRFESGSHPVRPWLAKLVKALFRQRSDVLSKKPRTSRVGG